jgi:hypothetical protein
MKIIKLDGGDITHLVRLILESSDGSEEYWKSMESKYGPKPGEIKSVDNSNLSSGNQNTPNPLSQYYAQQDEKLKQSKQGTPQGELSDTKSELRNQAITNINNLVNDKSVGSIVALFLFILTDKRSVMTIRQIAHKFNDHLSGGGKETDFSAAVIKSLRPIASKFVKSVVEGVEKKSAEYHQSGILGRDYNQDYLKEEQTDQDYYDLRASTTKNQLRQMALRSINQLANNKELYQIVSMFLLYLTDQQTISTLRSFASTYGAELDSFIDGSDPSWTENLIGDVRNKFIPLVESMAEAVDEHLMGVQNRDKVPDDTAKEKNPQFNEDRLKINNIIKKYNIK